ncbi:MAG: 4Fe-4S binding protein [Clostridiales bacterium]|nr:4Fe-4S binding protein [Clostridiales bacterium]
MSALETVKAMGREAALEKIKAAGLKDYGLKAGSIAERMEKAKGGAVEAGLNNAGTDQVLLALLAQSPEKVFEGMCAAAYVVGAETVTLYLPAGETTLAENLKETAGKYGVSIVNDIIDVRAAEECLLLHIVTAARLADLLEDSVDESVFISTDGNTGTWVAADTKVGDLVSLEGAKAVRMGYRLYTPAEAKERTAADAINGRIRVLGEKDCVVQEVLAQLGRDRQISCGKCVFCREGLIQLEYMQREITAARGKGDFLDLTREIGQAMCGNTLCTVGQESAWMALDAVEKFGDEYVSHMKKNKCPAGVCSAFEHIYIDPKACTGCGDCLDVCPKECIEGKAKYIHMIDEFECTKCGKCVEACGEEAIVRTSGKLPKLPTRLTKVGKFRKH